MARTPSRTYGRSFFGSGTFSASTSARVRTGFAIFGPPSPLPFSPFSNERSSPIAGRWTRMSEKRIAASKPNSSIGATVTWAMSSGERHSSRKPTFCRTAR